MNVDRSVKGAYQSDPEYNGSMLQEVEYSKSQNHLN